MKPVWPSQALHVGKKSDTPKLCGNPDLVNRNLRQNRTDGILRFPLKFGTDAN